MGSVKKIALDTNTAEGAIAAKQDAQALSQPQHGSDPDNLTVTRASIEAGISSAMGVIAATLTQNELFFEASDGRQRRVYSDTPVADLYDEATGEERPQFEKNVLAFDTKILLGGVVKQAEWLVDQSDQKVQQRTFYLRSMQQKLHRGDPSVSENDVVRADDWLGLAELERARRLVAFQTAVSSYEDLTGETFETRAMRLERERMGKAKNAALPRRVSAADAFMAG